MNSLQSKPGSLSSLRETLKSDSVKISKTSITVDLRRKMSRGEEKGGYLFDINNITTGGGGPVSDGRDENGEARI
jgi:hypothetical protein